MTAQSMTGSGPMAASWRRILGLVVTAFFVAGGPIQADRDPQTGDKADFIQTRTAMIDAAIAKSRLTHGPGKPALWRLSDDDTTLYLFGTIHLMRPGMDWQSPQIRAAFAQADTLVLEADTESESGKQAIMNEFVTRGLFEDEQTLGANLDDETRTTLEKRLASLEMPMTAIDPMEPWFAALNLMVMQAMENGYDVESGIDSILARDAAKAGKTLVYLETAKRQADVFDMLSLSEQHTMLREAVFLWDKAADSLDALVSEWIDGDVTGLAALSDPVAIGISDDLYQAGLVKRNQEWAEKIMAMLDQPGTFFIAVGAAHLVGSDSLTGMLVDAGYNVQGPLPEPGEQ